MRKYFFAFLFLYLSGCAEPTYLPASGDPVLVLGQNASKCELQFNNSKLCIDWTWLKMPTESEVGAFYFKIYRKNTVDGSAVLIDQNPMPQVLLWMPSMNHGSSPVTTFQADVGTYKAENVFFIMPGEWEIKFQIKNESHVLDEAIVRLTI
jgi:hypothetical protein